MDEKKVILLPADGRKGLVMNWSEVMAKFSITTKRLEQIIKDGEEIKGFYLDEALGR